MSSPSPAYRILDTIKSKKSKGLTLEAEAYSGGLKKGMTVRLQPEGQDIKIKDATISTGKKYILKIKGAALKSFTGKDWLFPYSANSFSSAVFPLILMKDFPKDEFDEGWILSHRGARTRVTVAERITGRLLILRASSPLSLIPEETVQISRGREIALKGRVCFKISPDKQKADNTIKMLSKLSLENELPSGKILEVLLDQDGIIFTPQNLKMDTSGKENVGNMLLTREYFEKIKKLINPLITRQGGVLKEELQKLTRIPKFQFKSLLDGFVKNGLIYIDSGYILNAGDRKGDGLSPMASQILSQIEKQGLKGLKISTLRSMNKNRTIDDLLRMHLIRTDGTWALGNKAFQELSDKIEASGNPPYSPGQLAEEWDLPRGLIYAVLKIRDEEL